MQLSPTQVLGIANHVGYGNPSAPVWFVGAEEGLGGRMSSQEREANLAARAAWAPVMDMLGAHRMLQEGGGYIRDLVNRSGSTGVWRIMARIARAYEGASDFEDAEQAAEYVRHRLGRADGDTFLTEISPFPAVRSKQPQKLRDFPDRELIRKALGDRRAEQRRILMEHHPRVLICYGSALYEDFEKHFAFKWRPLCTVQWVSKKSGTRKETDLFHASITHEAAHPTQVFLLPFFGNGALSPSVLRAFVESTEFQNCTGPRAR